MIIKDFKSNTLREVTEITLNNGQKLIPEGLASTKLYCYQYVEDEEEGTFGNVYFTHEVNRLGKDYMLSIDPADETSPSKVLSTEITITSISENGFTESEVEYTRYESCDVLAIGRAEPVVPSTTNSIFRVSMDTECSSKILYLGFDFDDIPFGNNHWLSNRRLPNISRYSTDIDTNWYIYGKLNNEEGFVLNNTSLWNSNNSRELDVSDLSGMKGFDVYVSEENNLDLETFKSNIESGKTVYVGKVAKVVEVD